MKKLALAIAVVGTFFSFAASGQEAKGLTGVEVPLEALTNIAPYTVLMIISDGNRKIHTVKVDHYSIPLNESLVRVISNDASGNTALSQGGCWVRNNGTLVWKNPCPY